MKQDHQHLLKPNIIHSVSGLSLIARVVVDGFLSGLNISRKVGYGQEFSQYRGYEPGDDLRLLDWKMLARSGRYYIKQADVETHIPVKFIIDCSNSMQHKEGELSKLDYVRVLVASLAYLADRQGDAVGVYGLNDKELKSLPPQVQKQQLNRVLYELVQMSPRGTWPKDASRSELLHSREKRELIFFVTDLHEEDEELISMVHSLKTLRNEVVLFHVLGKQEKEFAYKGELIFEDLETGNRVKVNADKARKLYLDALETRIGTLKSSLLSKGIGYHLFIQVESLPDALLEYLHLRTKLA